MADAAQIGSTTGSVAAQATVGLSVAGMVTKGRDTYLAMPSVRRNWLSAALLLIGAVIAATIWFAERTDWRPLFNGLEARDLQQVSQELGAAGIPFETTPDGTGIEVPSELVDKARMEVAAKGNAQFRIRGAILDSLRTLDWSPRELRRKGGAVEEAIRSVTQRVGRAPLEAEIAGEMKLTLIEYQGLLGDLKGLEIGSLHIERSQDSGDEELAYIPGAPDEDPLFRCLRGEMKQKLADAIEELPDKERMVLTLYYFEELTMKEIGLTLGVVESRVSQIHSSAVVRLRSALASLRPAGAEVKKRTRSAL